MVQKHDQANSSRRSIVVVEQASNPLAPADTPFAGIGVRSNWIDQSIA
jgi:hypothetical protein